MHRRHRSSRPRSSTPDLTQNCHAMTGDRGATSSHHSSPLVPDARRRMISPGLMKATGDALGWPPAIHVDVVRTSHGTIQSATSAALAQTSREAWVRGRGVAAIGSHHGAASRVTRCGQSSACFSAGVAPSEQRAYRPPVVRTSCARSHAPSSRARGPQATRRFDDRSPRYPRPPRPTRRSAATGSEPTT